MWRPYTPERPGRPKPGTAFATHCGYAAPAGGLEVPQARRKARRRRLRVASSLEGGVPVPSASAASAHPPALATLSVSFVCGPSHTLTLRGGTEVFELDGHAMISDRGLASAFPPRGPTVVIHDLSMEPAG